MNDEKAEKYQYSSILNTSNYLQYLWVCFGVEEYNGRSFTILYFFLPIYFAFEDGGKKIKPNTTF